MSHAGYLEIDGLTKTYNAGTANEVRALRGLALTAREGEFISVVGSNAAGKTTLLNIIAGALLPDAGDVRLGGASIIGIPEHAKAAFVSRVKQNPNDGLIVSMTIAENLAMAKLRALPVGLRRGVKHEWRGEFADLLLPFGIGLERRLDDRAELLSGGQRQTVALLMAVMTAPKLLLLDEHTAALDPRMSERILEETATLVRKFRATTLMVTHNISHALRYGDRLILLDRGRIAFDASGEAKKKLTVYDVVSRIEHHATELEADIRA